MVIEENYYNLQKRLESTNWMFGESVTLEIPPYKYTEGEEISDDDEMIRRLIQEYNRVVNLYKKTGSFWDEWTETEKKDIHEALINQDFHAVKNLLRNPSQNQLFLGFDWNHKTFNRDAKNKDEAAFGWLHNHSLSYEELLARLIYDGLMLFAADCGVVRTEYPEKGIDFIRKEKCVDVNSIISGIKNAIGIDFDFPNPFKDEFGIIINGGVISYRAIQSLFQAYRLNQFIMYYGLGKKVLEIGGGLGRTAYYASKMYGMDYTIVDIPITNVAQGYYLGLTLGNDLVAFNKEKNYHDKIKILSASSLDEITEQYDVIINCDSITEFDWSTQNKYWEFIANHSMWFFSINHEGNSHTVRDLYADDFSVDKYWRQQYTLRRGYVEEIIKFKG